MKYNSNRVVRTKWNFICNRQPLSIAHEHPIDYICVDSSVLNSRRLETKTPHLAVSIRIDDGKKACNLICTMLPLLGHGLAELTVCIVLCVD